MSNAWRVVILERGSFRQSPMVTHHDVLLNKDQWCRSNAIDVAAP